MIVEFFIFFRIIVSVEYRFVIIIELVIICVTRDRILFVKLKN